MHCVQMLYGFILVVLGFEGRVADWGDFAAMCVRASLTVNGKWSNSWVDGLYQNGRKATPMQ